MYIYIYIYLYIYVYICIYIYSQLSVSRTHLVGLVGFVSSSMLNLSDKSDMLDWINRTFLYVGHIL